MPIAEDDLLGLSAVERESLMSTDEDDEDLVRELGLPSNPGAAPAPAAAANAAADPDDDDDAAGAATAAPAAATPAPAPAGDTATAADGDDDVPVVPQRLTPNDAVAQRTALRTESAEALEKLLGGEIDQAAYSEISNRVQDQLDSLVRAEASDSAREQLVQDSMMADYNRDLRNSHKELRTAGLDVTAVTAEFDRAVRMFAQEAGERGLTDAPGNLAASKAALAEATEYVLRRHGKAVAAAPAATPAPARQPRPVDRSTFPPTLANVPVAADASITNEFAHLDGLEGSTLERALARLTPEQQERYLT